MLAFGPAIVLLGAAQALAVALPGAGWPGWLWRPRTRLWAAVMPVSIVAVIGGIAAAPGIANGLTWLALVAVPPLAAAALGWASRGATADGPAGATAATTPAARPARPLLAVLSLPLFVAAWAFRGDLAGDVTALALSTLACVTLARLVAGLAPTTLVKLGIVVAAVVDTALIVGHQLQHPNALLNAAAPAAHLPKLQLVQLGPAVMGFGDVFIAALLGATLAAEGRPQAPAAALTLVAASLMDLLFYVTDELPATVPVAIAMLLLEALRRRRRR